MTANLSEGEKAEELDFVRETVLDVATDEQERVAALVEKALGIGGDPQPDSASRQGAGWVNAESQILAEPG